MHVGELLLVSRLSMSRTLHIAYASHLALCSSYRGIGQVIGVGVIKAMLNRDDEWS